MSFSLHFQEDALMELGKNWQEKDAERNILYMSMFASCTYIRHVFIVQYNIFCSIIIQYNKLKPSS
jgi:hypothetical protein